MPIDVAERAQLIGDLADAHEGAQHDQPTPAAVPSWSEDHLVERSCEQNSHSSAAKA